LDKDENVGFLFFTIFFLFLVWIWYMLFFFFLPLILTEDECQQVSA
jgi:hypothetical protein